jgi:hypothetical protein
MRPTTGRAEEADNKTAFMRFELYRFKVKTPLNLKILWAERCFYFSLLSYFCAIKLTIHFTEFSFRSIISLLMSLFILPGQIRVIVRQASYYPVPIRQL